MGAAVVVADAAVAVATTVDAEVPVVAVPAAVDTGLTQVLEEETHTDHDGDNPAFKRHGLTN